jgi:hypothetical protein
VELTRKARRKSLPRTEGSNLPPDSAKIRKILELLKEINARENDEGEPTGEKTIVFSQFTTMLDLIQLFLKDAGIAYARCEFASPLLLSAVSTDGLSSSRRREYVQGEARSQPESDQKQSADQGHLDLVQSG